MFTDYFELRHYELNWAKPLRHHYVPTKNPPAMTGVCHCKNCQRQAESAFSTLAGVAKKDFVLKSGQMKVYKDSETETGNTVECHFCGECGSPTYSAIPDSPDALFIKTGQWTTPLIFRLSSTCDPAASKIGLS